MIAVSENALLRLCERIGIKRETLVFLGGGREDSDGIAYTYPGKAGKMVLKILSFPKREKNSLEKLAARVKFANYLGEHGIDLAFPILNDSKNLYETVEDGDDLFVAYIMAFREGNNPKSTELSGELVKVWGRLTGKSHKITKTYHWRDDQDYLGYQNEVDFFMNWCKDKAVKVAWEEMNKQLSELPKDCSEYGFIHNDNHQNNILVADKKITLIDFDCACPQFFVQDITTPAQGLMFDITGGMMSPITDSNRLKQFFDDFINGYEQENSLGDFWYQKLDPFLNYRRLLLYTCMEDWIVTQPDLHKGFVQMIQNPPTIFHK